MPVNSKTKRLAELALLSAIALIIFTVELNIPNPTPIAGIKLGLANIITVYGVYRYKAGEIALVLFVRIVLGSLFSPNPSAILYSLAGGTFCLLGMLLLKKNNTPKPTVVVQRVRRRASQCGADIDGLLADENLCGIYVSAVFNGKRLHCGAFHGSVRPAAFNKAV